RVSRAPASNPSRCVRSGLPVPFQQSPGSKSRPRTGWFWFQSERRRVMLRSMALVRVLIDGYSLLHGWPELAPGRARHSAAARDELIERMKRYQDVSGTPITIFFDGGGAPSGTPKEHSTPEVEILYSRSGQTADQLIERAARRFGDYGEVLAVTD